MRAWFRGGLEPFPAVLVPRDGNLELGGAEPGEFRGDGFEHHRESRQTLGKLRTPREYDAAFDRRLLVLDDRLPAGDALVESRLRIHERGAARAVHQRPGGHLVAAEHDADDVAHVDDHDAAAGEQHEIEVEIAAVAIRHEHVTQEIRRSRGYARNAPRFTTPHHVRAAAEKGDERHGDGAEHECDKFNLGQTKWRVQGGLVY